MKKVICENARKDKLTFTYDFPFFLSKIDGIYKVSGNVSMVSSAFGIGETYYGTSIEKRNIIITGIIKDNFQERRRTLYDMFPLKSKGTLYYYENNIGKKIEYVVEDIDIAEKGIPRDFTISLICPYPYFTDIEKSQVSMSYWTPLFEFPMVSEEIESDEGIEFETKNVTTMGVINNDTNIEFGIDIIFEANGNVINPFLVNVETQERMEIDIEMNSGDKILVTTQRNKKDIFYIADSTSELQNINYLKTNISKFLQMHSGVNTLRARSKDK
ncbi:MAG: phage tail family protein [Clostridia bacterium]|nr:phage tail family protein [Clostridia bacterium]